MSAANTKEVTGTRSGTIEELYHESMRSYEKALKSCIRLQEKSVNLWKDAFRKFGSAEELQAKFESIAADGVPNVRKRMDEFVETFNRTSNETIHLFRKTLAAYQAASVTEAQRRVRDLIDSSVSALRGNVERALRTNAEIIAACEEIVDRFCPAAK
jgi:hypothetical protein